MARVRAVVRKVMGRAPIAAVGAADGTILVIKVGGGIVRGDEGRP
ncbi:hypothetical protein GCM10010280_04800 [Streptomyces pilosus]|uniref:Uncharacterized protein n=1 Tax=Streptomyces pilosus TaxID=28893 RepID=A0A918ETW2_9ACTN|nr:hypothetical protein GCM10010280_04800 [Streptomyces pilosus]